METCVRCGITLDENIEYTNIAHTDVYYCDKCLGKPYQPERLSPEAQCPNCTLEDDCDVCWEKYLETLRCDSLNIANK